MSKLSRVIFILGVSIFAIATNVFAALTPAGRWQTIDDETHKPRSIVTIAIQKNSLVGNIAKVFYNKGEGPNDVCNLCSGQFHNKKILGMPIMWGLTQVSPTQWSNGTILDPHNGKTYRCQITLNKDGSKMTVRGYIGMPLFGRSQTWIRVASK